MKEKWETGYKVVYVQGWNEVKAVRFESCTVSTRCEGSGVRYMVDKITEPRPNFGPLAVFCNLDDAISFMGSQRIEWRRIYTCRFVRSYESGMYNMRGFRHLCDAPPGTVLADKVILRRRVKI